MRHTVRVAIIGLAFGLVAGVAPASAQIDLVGEWLTPRAVQPDGAIAQQLEDGPHRAEGPELGDYTGLPINDFARKKAEAWSASVLSQPERQGNPHPAQYSMRGGGGPNLRISKIIDPVTTEWLGYRIEGFYGGANRTIWMDGRPHPSANAEHTWDGFSTGLWEGNMLTVTTTHMKMAFIQRNGVPSSPYGTMTEHFARHGNYLTVMTVIDDPLFLEEPLMRTVTFVWTPQQNVGAPTLFDPSDELGNRPLGWVPHNAQGSHQTEFATRFGIPFEATQGGKETTYPEYMETLAALRAKQGKR